MTCRASRSMGLARCCARYQALFASLCLALAALGACSKDDAGEWVAVSKDTLVIGVEITGTLKATQSVSVGPPGLQDVWEYKIANLAPEGEPVAVGDFLLAFDASTLEEQLLTEENRRDTAQTQLDKTRSEFELVERDAALALAEAEAEVRKATLSADQSEELTSNLTLQKARIDRDAAVARVDHLMAQMKRRAANGQATLASIEAQLRRAEKQVQRLQSNIAAMTITAQKAGTVIYGTSWDEEKFKVGDRVWRAANVIEVATLDSMMAEGSIDEADSAVVRLGQSVRVRLDAHPDSEVIGTITDIARNVQRKSRDIPTKVVQVKMKIDAIDGLQLRPGMRYRGEVETERIADALIIPVDAIFSSPEGPVAYKRQGDSSQRTLLTLGKRGKRGVQVLSGLAKGDSISRTERVEGTQ